MDDEELVRRIQAGERHLLEELSTRYVEPLFDFFRRNRVQEQDAEDLVQETLLQCLASIGAFRGGSAFRTWLFHMARNRLVDFQRRPKAARATSAELAGLAALPDPPPNVSPFDRYRAALARLSAEPRELLRLVHEEDLACAAAAERLGVSVPTVRRRLAAAYRELKEVLAAEESKDAEE